MNKRIFLKTYKKFCIEFYKDIDIRLFFGYYPFYKQFKKMSYKEFSKKLKDIKDCSSNNISMEYQVDLEKLINMANSQKLINRRIAKYFSESLVRNIQSFLRT